MTPRKPFETVRFLGNHHVVLPGLIACATLAAACAARAPARPAGQFSPDPTAVAAFNAATSPCAGLSTVTAALRLSGRAGGERIRGTLHTGLAAPASLRFEAVAPFGPPVFILAGRNNRATLYFPRDNRVIPEAGVDQILERLTGLALGASDLRLILTGCLAENPVVADGRGWSGGWRAVTVSTEPAAVPTAAATITAYLRNVNGTPVVVAADYARWRVDYANHQNSWPRSVRIRMVDAGAEVDVTALLEELSLNTRLDDKAFAVEVPSSAERITLDHLRSVAPLRGSS